jgi:fatty-acyl-CoA synthase
MVNYAPLTPLSFLQRSAYVFRDKVAVVHDNRRYTYAELARRVRRLATALHRSGIEKGDRVAVLAPNIPALLEAHYGVPFAGGVLVAINTRLSSSEVLYILNHSRAKIFLVDTELAPVVRRVIDDMQTVRRVINVDDSGSPERLNGPTYEEFLAEGSDVELPLPVEAERDQLISINYTSGTTGNSKGVMYSHRGAFLNAVGQALEMGLTARSVYLWTLPMFHCNGWCYTWAVTAAGATHVCLRRVDPPIVFDLIKKERVTHLCAAPIVLNTLVNHPRSRAAGAATGLRIATGGAPPSPSLLEQMEAMGAELTHLYGLTETYGPNTICEWQPAWDSHANVAKARLKARQGVPHITSGEVRVVDEEMSEVPADGNTIGEVVLRGNTVMLGYFEQPEATADAFRGGWFHTGDLGVMHPDGYVELRDRKKDIIISGGENISTIEVENVLYEHPAILEVAVIAIPDDRWGEVPKAFVTLKPGAELTQDALIDFCRDRIAHFKAPRAVEFCDLPKTSTGKIQKFILREKEWEGRERRIN